MQIGFDVRTPDAGWIKDEFEALAASSFAERGHVTDEYLEEHGQQFPPQASDGNRP